MLDYNISELRIVTIYRGYCMQKGQVLTGALCILEWHKGSKIGGSSKILFLNKYLILEERAKL